MPAKAPNITIFLANFSTVHSNNGRSHSFLQAIQRENKSADVNLNASTGIAQSRVDEAIFPIFWSHSAPFTVAFPTPLNVARPAFHARVIF